MSGFRLLLVGLLFLSGCTNTLYQGELVAPDAYGQERSFVLYWTRTDPLLGQSKAGPAILLTECSPLTRIDFTDQAEGIIFRGTPGQDSLADTETGDNDNLICGKVTNVAAFSEAGPGPMMVKMDCVPAGDDEFSLQPRNYLAARTEPYPFAIVEKEKVWSLMGKTLTGPSVPECRENRL